MGRHALTTELDAVAADVAGITPTTNASDLTSGTVAFARLPTGTSGSQVAVGNHDHSALYQPVDSDLTAIAALATTSYGRSLLTQADAAAARTTLGLGLLATAVPVHPSADLTCTSTVTLANWSGFSFPVTDGFTYDFDGIIYYTGDSNADARFGCTAPAGTLRVAGAGLGGSSSSLPGNVQISDVIDASGEYLTVGCVTSTRQALAFSGTFACTTAGTLQFQGAQAFSNLTATVFQAFGSRLNYTVRPT